MAIQQLSTKHAFCKENAALTLLFSERRLLATDSGSIEASRHSLRPVLERTSRSVCEVRISVSAAGQKAIDHTLLIGD